MWAPADNCMWLKMSILDGVTNFGRGKDFLKEILCHLSLIKMNTSNTTFFSIITSKTLKEFILSAINGCNIPGIPTPRKSLNYRV